MMYNEKLAVAIKSAGKVLREDKDQVYLPFGTEYSILIKNLNTVKVLVEVFVDGKTINDSGNGKFVIHPGQNLELERTITNGNMNAGNCFKFIERSVSVENHRGIGIEDGLVTVKYQFEKKIHTVDYLSSPYQPTPWWSSGPGSVFRNSPLGSGGSGDVPIGGGTVTCNSFVADANVSTTRTFVSSEQQLSQNVAGITVPGSVSNQRFVHVDSFDVEREQHVIILRLVGRTEKTVVTQAVNVKYKPKCISCGRTNKATAKFCTNCGTSLILV